MPTYTKEQITKLCSIKNEKARLLVAEYLDTAVYTILDVGKLLDVFLAVEDVYLPKPRTIITGFDGYGKPIQEQWPVGRPVVPLSAGRPFYFDPEVPDPI